MDFTVHRVARELDVPIVFDPRVQVLGDLKQLPDWLAGVGIGGDLFPLFGWDVQVVGLG
jgi:hypothetical protein